MRPETFAGRWAAKEAVSKVLGLGVRGIGWRDIEVERLPTGQPSVRLHGRAAARAGQLGMERIALSISHESDYAVAIAFGIRTAGGRYVFPLDIEERLDDRERRLLARMERLRDVHAATTDEALAAPTNADADPRGRTGQRDADADERRVVSIRDAGPGGASDG
jgi:phosphopantetheinyl transferase